MEKNLKFAIEEIQKIKVEDYDEDEFAIAKLGFLSTRPNSHQLDISEEVLRECASTALGKWLIADMSGVVDASTHTDNQVIVGRIPENQDIEFIEDDDGYLRAYADAIISKIYAKDYYAMFDNDNERAVSVEMKVSTPEEDENTVLSFKIVAVTTLGHQYRPSCPESNITITRFSEEDADAFFNKVHNNTNFTSIEQFAKKRKELMEEKKTYKIDKSKDSLSDKAWGDVDKVSMRGKIMSAKNRSALVKAVYMLIEDGWEDAPSEHLKYPVMELKGDTFVYNRNGLASALAYAKQEGEDSVVNKLNKIYKNLGLNQDGKEREAKMEEIKFAAVEIGDMWDKVWSALYKRNNDYNYSIQGIYEESNQKFALLKERDSGILYRLNFSLTEEGLTLADEITQVAIEVVEKDNIQKFAEPEDVEKYRTFAEENSEKEEKTEEKTEMAEDETDGKNEEEEKDDKDEEDEHDEEMSCEDMKAEMARLQAEIENRDNIIMNKDAKMSEMEAELTELRDFKLACDKEKMSTSVNALMSEVKECLSEDKYNELRDEGLNCEMSELSAWTNKVKAVCFDAKPITKSKKNKDEVWSFAAPIENQTETQKSSLWG